MLHALIGETPLRWGVTLLFAISVGMYAYLVVTQRDQWTARLTHLLHLTMSVAMVLMVWRVGLDLPAVGPTLFFLLAGIWFVGVAAWASSASPQRLKTCYYAAMMAAMAWMYALMSGAVPGVSAHLHAQPGSAVMDMPGMQPPAHDMSPATTRLRLGLRGELDGGDGVRRRGCVLVVPLRRPTPDEPGTGHRASGVVGTAVSGVHRRRHRAHVRRADRVAMRVGGVHQRFLPGAFTVVDPIDSAVDRCRGVAGEEGDHVGDIEGLHHAAR